MRHRPYPLAMKKLSLPREIVGRVELRLPPNPEGTGPAYGAWSALIEALLRDWLEEVEKNTLTEKG